MARNRSIDLIENYIYLYHIDKFVVLPTFPESIQDSLRSSFNTTNIMARTAPIFSYKYSGPRTIQVSIKLHRDMMQEINYGVSNINVELGDDYVDTLVNELQAVALPKYSASDKMVNPPMVALRFGNQVFIKGVVDGGITTTYQLPLQEDGKYAVVNISFNISEIDPYDAETVINRGEIRGLAKTLERNLYKQV